MNLKNPNAKIRTRMARAIAFASMAFLLAMIGTSDANAQGKPGKPPPPPPPGPRWTMTVIDDPRFENETLDTDINESGQILIYSIDPSGTGATSRLYVYDPVSGVITSIEDLLSPEDDAYWALRTQRINDLGQLGGPGFIRDPITGLPNTSGSNRRPLVVTLPPAESQLFAIVDDLGITGDAGIEYIHGAFGINNLGDLVGGYGTTPSTHAAHWSPTSGMTLLPSPAGSPTSTEPRAIDDSRQIVGNANFPNGASRALYWASPTATPLVIPYIALGLNNIPSGYAADMNASGVIVGASSAGKTGKGSNSTSLTHAFSYALPSGPLSDLGSLGRDSYATAINDNGFIVGWYKSTSGGTGVFYYTTANGMVDMQSAITNLPTGAQLVAFPRINNSNQISTRVRLADGRQRPALLLPWLP